MKSFLETPAQYFHLVHQQVHCKVLWILTDNQQNNVDCIGEEAIVRHQENQTRQTFNENQCNFLQGFASSEPNETELYYFEDQARSSFQENKKSQ